MRLVKHPTTGVWGMVGEWGTPYLPLTRAEWQRLTAAAFTNDRVCVRVGCLREMVIRLGVDVRVERPTHPPTTTKGRTIQCGGCGMSGVRVGNPDIPGERLYFTSHPSGGWNV